MSHFTQNKLLFSFAQKFIKTARDLTIHETNTLLEGNAKPSFDRLIYEKLNHLGQEDINTIKLLMIDTIDGALDNFFWMIEQEEEFDLIAYKEGKKHFSSLREASDGLSVDYWNFVEEFSNYPTAEKMAGYDALQRINHEKLFSEQHLVQLFSENNEIARRYFINALNKRAQYELLKTRIHKIPRPILESLIEMTLSRSSFHQEQCEEILEILNGQHE